jgi:hypothetical protein
MPAERLQTLSEVNRSLRQGDLLLWKASGNPASFLIGVFGRAGISHAAQVKGRPNQWQLQEVVQWHGGQVRPLDEAIRQEPGRILWYAANAGNRWPQWSPTLAVRKFDRLIGCRYGWWNLLRVGLLHFPLLRSLMSCLLIRQATDDKAGEGPAPFCSQAVAIAARAGGVDPVPHLADDCTEPADLARSLFYEYQATLVPEGVNAES